MNPKGIFLPEITAGTATDLGLKYLEGGEARESVKFNPAAMIDAKLKILEHDAKITNNADLACIAGLARHAFFEFMLDGGGRLIQRNYDETMVAWSAKLEGW